ncbi:hypothetical protein [Hyphomicrobium sp. 802]|uniref:hypothetical protein n=1 Tax=unclassified Hyphomicrobium TaxID=2619925 RepID=UPI00045EA7D9|nr:hypothetical protein [Hyphomicrobium sp. 802]
MTFRSIYWDDKDARLKGFSSVTKDSTVAVLKIEIVVRDTYRLSALLDGLAEIKREQAAADKAAAAEVKRPKRRAIENKPPLLLTFRED